MKKFIFLLIFNIIISPVHAKQVFNSFEEYNLSLPNVLFSKDKSGELDVSYSKSGEKEYSWSNDSQRINILIKNNYISINKKKYPIKEANTFFDSKKLSNNFGLNPKIYYSNDFLCVEGHSSSASGTATRHASVYLLGLKDDKLFFQLPSLFASCQGIRFVNGNIYFDKVSYFYSRDEKSELPSGVIFNEYSYQKGRFEPTYYAQFGKFLENENVYRFYLMK